MDDTEKYVLDACVVIDFCGRTNSLAYLMVHVGDSAVVTTSVQEELERQRAKAFPRLSEFLCLVSSGKVQVIDPDLTDEIAGRIVKKWSRSFGAGEVSSAALAASRRWIFVSRDREPMRQLRLSETLLMESTEDILKSLVRRRNLTKKRADGIEAQIKAASTRRRRK